jgi:hypothetical protein
MATRDEIEHYLIQTGHPHETLDNNMWVVRDAANIVISHAPPLGDLSRQAHGRAATQS